MSKFEIKILIHFHPSCQRWVYIPRIIVLLDNKTIASYFLVCVATKTSSSLQMNAMIPRSVPARMHLSLDTLRGRCQNLPWFLTSYHSVMQSWIRGFKGVSNQLTPAPHTFSGAPYQHLLQTRCYKRPFVVLWKRKNQDVEASSVSLHMHHDVVIATRPSF